MSNDVQPNIIIIGAGLGGLCLAQGLKRASIPFRIFERDSSISWRGQGYRITLKPDGPGAILDCVPSDLWKLFEQTAIMPTNGFAGLNALDAQPFTPEQPPWRRQGEARPQSPAEKTYVIDRTVLRTLLTLGLGENIHYSKKLERFESKDDGVTAFFHDGEQYTGSLLVAADGASSMVRRQHIPDHILYDTGLRTIYGKTPITQELRARYNAQAIDHTSIIRQDDNGLNLLADPVCFSRDPHSIDSRLCHVDDYIYWALFAKSEVFGAPGDKMLSMSPEEAKALSLTTISKWHPSFRPVLELQDTSQTAILRMHTSNPAIPHWKPNPRVTLIGDAVHPMLPTGASGANTALRDAANLCKLLVEAQGRTSVEMIAAFEKNLREYGGDRVGFSIQNAAKLGFDIPSFEHYTPIMN